MTCFIVTYWDIPCLSLVFPVFRDLMRSYFVCRGEKAFSVLLVPFAVRLLLSVATRWQYKPTLAAALLLCC